MKKLDTFFVCVVLGIGVMTTTHAAEVKLIAGDATEGDNFGRSVSISGDYAIVGAPFNDDNEVDSGSAYIFFRDGTSWKEQAKLTAGDPGREDNFGYAAAIDGDYAIIGAWAKGGDETGAAYIFFRSGTNWKEQAKLTASDSAEGNFFGRTVAINGDYAIVGSPFNDDGGQDAGSAYIFFRNGITWKEQVKLIAGDAEEGDQLGSAVAISGDYAIIGSPADDDAGSKSGSAYIFFRSGNTWKEQAKLTAGDVAEKDNFGSAVAISGDYAIVGSPSDDDAGSKSGSAYAFVRSGTTWKEEAKLTASDAAAGDKFGQPVAISGKTALIGTPSDDDAGDSSGSVYAFLRSGGSWIERAKQTASNAAAGDKFGQSVAISGDYAIVGALDADSKGDAAGSAYIYHSIEDFALSVELSLFTATMLGQVKRMALLQNFPNPFNPETWLPYELAAEVPVVIRIYDVQGQFIRQLNLGIQEEGSYLSRETAAYWNGKDQFGETVSSGIYFYTLTAGDYQATRRMVILK